MISLQGVSKWYQGQTKVLDHVQLELKKGDFLYVIGGSGAGKSTLLSLLATEELPSSGKISLFGYDLATVSPSTLRAIRQSLGYVPQNIRLIPDLTVFENVAISVSLAGSRVLKKESRARILELLDVLGLAGKKDKAASSLSGGEAQRVAVVRALARSPEVLIADEPTGSQDRDFTWTLMDLFMRSNVAATTVVVATHDREIVRRVRKPSALLKAGRMSVEDGLCTL